MLELRRASTRRSGVVIASDLASRSGLDHDVIDRLERGGPW
jgi:hypothetical protein